MTNKPLDMIQEEYTMRAGPLKVSVYRVRDPETGEFGDRQFHMTYDNLVLGVMHEEAAKLFAKTVRDLTDMRDSGVPAVVPACVQDGDINNRIDLTDKTEDQVRDRMIEEGFTVEDLEGWEFRPVRIIFGC